MNLLLIDYFGRKNFLTAEEFHERIMREASHSDWNWGVPVTEIAKFVKKPYFPKEYRDDICQAVLKCFTRIQAEHCISDCEQEAVWECFMLLNPEVEENERARSGYIQRLINKSIHSSSIFPLHIGESWGNFCQEFRKEKDAEWRKIKSKREIQKWAQDLQSEFAARLEKAEAEGIFDEDDKKEGKKLAEDIIAATRGFPI